MALNLKDAETHELARELAARRGVTMTQAVKDALAEALRHSAPASLGKFERLEEISLRAARLPVLDDRSPDEILGYDNSGMPA